MKILNINADVTEIGIAQNGDIMCEVEITYKRTWKIKRSRAVHVFNISEELKKWEK